MNRRTFFQNIAVAITGIVASVYAPGLLKETGPWRWLGIDLACGPLGGYWFETRFKLGPWADPVIWGTYEHYENLLILAGVNDA